MKDEKIQKLKALKEKFNAMEAHQRENLSVCFLKVKLGVQSFEEFDVVANFLGDLKIKFNPENVDKVINYLHAKDHTLPEFIAMEESLSDMERVTTQPELPIYNPDDVETLKEIENPFKKK